MLSIVKVFGLQIGHVKRETSNFENIDRQISYEYEHFHVGSALKRI